MPELPEVETIKNTLIPIIKNNTILFVEVLRDKTISSGSEVFQNKLIGQSFLDVTRKGKYLIFHLTNHLVILSHLRMEGKYYDLKENEENTKYARVIFHLSNHRKLCYDDSRCFGRMILSDEENYFNVKEIAKLGKEPWEIDDVDYLVKAAKNKRIPIKSFLLDQSIMTGLGNIYTDETLYASKIHPLTPANKIKKEEFIALVTNAKEILKTAITMGGSTIKSYHPGKGIDGNFQTRIQIYGKQNQVCPKCFKTFRFIKVGGRGTTFCPGCQHKVGAPLIVAVTGKISTGKSLITEQFKLKGYPTLSCDKIIADLYREPSIADKISHLLKIDFKGKSVNKKILRDHLLIYPKDKRKLERFIHPEVNKVVQKFIREAKGKIKVVEVPLLFESGMDQEFEVILAPICSLKKQTELIENRDKEKALYLLEINASNQFEKYQGKIDYLIDNNATKEAFICNINEVISKLKNSL